MFKERYFPSIRLNDWLNAHAIETEIIGNSELGKPIHAIRLGEGPVKILMWSQMHGNESTTTRGLLIWLEEYLQSPSYLKELSLLIIPQLPDNYVDPQEIHSLDKKHLKDAFNVVEDGQSTMGVHFNATILS